MLLFMFWKIPLLGSFWLTLTTVSAMRTMLPSMPAAYFGLLFPETFDKMAGWPDEPFAPLPVLFDADLPVIISKYVFCLFMLLIKSETLVDDSDGILLAWLDREGSYAPPPALEDVEL